MVAVTYGVARAAAGALKAKKKVKTPGFFARLMTAMMDARMQQARRELQLHQHLTGKNDDPFVL